MDRYSDSRNDHQHVNIAITWVLMAVVVVSLIPCAHQLGVRVQLHLVTER